MTAGASRSTFPSSTSCMIARAVKDLEAEARMNGVCGVTTRPEPSASPKPLKVRYLVVVHDAESQAGDAHIAHLLGNVGVDGDEVGAGRGWRIGVGRHSRDHAQGHREEHQRGHLSPRFQRRSAGPGRIVACGMARPAWKRRLLWLG